MIQEGAEVRFGGDKIGRVVAVGSDAITVEYGYDGIDHIEHGDYSVIHDSYAMYLNEEHRADEAEKRADAAEANWEKLKEYVDFKITESDKDYQATHDAIADGACDAYEDVYRMIKNLERGEE
ncbi:hypothetical protein [Macrococcus brunensis]|uniref:hypothetical protein n=1 Tax=Macrococcus brunensis TaxID=198483 RepID=UPI001EF1055B|nr:hypothetical protein [Macrococcus brunensis]ULG73200.1 hypothetical protein MGG13_05600 [Macrococcus brunensis]